MFDVKKVFNTVTGRRIKKLEEKQKQSKKNSSVGFRGGREEEMEKNTSQGDISQPDSQRGNLKERAEMREQEGLSFSKHFSERQPQIYFVCFQRFIFLTHNNETE